jgi:hypothetical protein
LIGLLAERVRVEIEKINQLLFSIS